MKLAWNRHHVIWVAGLFFAGSLMVRFWGLNAAGNVWDEYFYYDATHDFVRNVVQRDFQAGHWKSNFEHPPIGKYVYAPALIWNKWRHISNQEAYHAPRVISAALGSLTVALVFLIGASYISLRSGLVAGIIYGLAPPVLAYHKIINLDVTMVLLFTLAMYFYLDWVQKRTTKNLWLAVIVGSLAIATKFNAIFLAVIFYGILIIDQSAKLRKTGAIAVPLPLLLFPAIMGVILIAVWPWLWSNTLDHFLLTLNHWGGTISELFLGRFRPAPVSYFIVHFLVGTPLLILLLMPIGLWKVVKTKKRIGWTLLAWLIAPFLISFYHLRQDHLRYVLAAFPAVALIAAIGFWWLMDLISKSRFYLKIFSVLFLIFYLLVIIFKIHPYYLDYYNELVGGPKGVVKKNLFGLGFYGEGIKEATEYINNTARDGALVHYEVIPDDAPYLDRPRLIRYDANKHIDRGYDYLIVNANALWDEKKKQLIKLDDLDQVYAVKADGAEFVWVYKKN